MSNEINELIAILEHRTMRLSARTMSASWITSEDGHRRLVLSVIRHTWTKDI